MMTRKKMLIYGGFALIITVASWLGGYLFFVNSEEYYSVVRVIKNSEVIKLRVGNVKDISVSLWDFQYKFSGDWARAELNVEISGEKDIAEFSIDIEKNRKDGWVIKRVVER